MKRDQPRIDLETVSADLLNGVMIVLLGCAFPAFITWRATIEFAHQQAATGKAFDEWPPVFSFNSAWLAAISLYIAWHGVKHVRKTLARLSR
jgi:hypothetical protein